MVRTLRFGLNCGLSVWGIVLTAQFVAMGDVLWTAFSGITASATLALAIATGVNPHPQHHAGNDLSDGLGVSHSEGL